MDVDVASDETEKEYRVYVSYYGYGMPDLCDMMANDLAAIGNGTIEAEDDEGKYRYILNDGKWSDVQGETLTYFEGFADEFIQQLQEEVIRAIRATA